MSAARVLVLSITLGILGTLLPVVFAINLSWSTALSEETRHLGELASQVAERTARVFREAADTLRSIEGMNLAPCSPEHIGEMRRLTINSRSVREIGFTENGVLRCTSWGNTDIHVRQRPSDFRTQDGAAVVTNISPVVSGGNRVIALRVGVYNALISPRPLVEMLADSDLKVAVAHAGGTVIAVRDEGSRDLVRALFQAGFGAESSHLIVSTRRQGEWAVAVAASRSAAQAIYVRQLSLFVPIGAVMGALAAGAVFWLSRKRLSPAGELALAVRRREFIVHYQPVIDLRTGTCIGAEALVRWRQRDGSLVMPDLFIPLAEETGLIQSITDQVVAKVISDLGGALSADRGLHVAINLASADIMSGRIPDLLQSALAGTGIEASQIWLEVTEHVLIDIEAARETLTLAQSRGHVVLIDDFGTGYSSLRHLSNLPLDAVKIDKSFIDAIGREAVTSLVTQHIMKLAKELGLFMVAEGVEKQEQAEYLADHGVEYAQGWYYFRPLPPDDLIAFVQSAQPTAPSPIVREWEGLR